MHIEKVILVFKTHFDIGFTALAKEVLADYAGPMLERVLDTCEQTEQDGDMRFVWTLPAWPLRQMEADCAPTLRARLDALAQNGQLYWHALPFTSHYDFCSPEDAVWGLHNAQELSREHDRHLPVSGKLTDVPGAGWMLPEILARAGIHFLHIGCNEFAWPAEVPPLFWWEAPGGSRVLTMYNPCGYGTGIQPPNDWPFPVWMALMNTQDNCGPQSAEILQELLHKVHLAHPEARVLCGTPDDFYEELCKCDLSHLPVIRKDLADTWIHGIGSYPAEVSQLRRLRPRLRLAEFTLAVDEHLDLAARALAEKHLADAHDAVALFAEHTWGLDVKTHLGKIPNYTTNAFNAYRESERCRRMELSWKEQALRAKAAADAVIETERLLNYSPTQSVEPPMRGTVLHGLCRIRGANAELSFDADTGRIIYLIDIGSGETLLTDRDGRGAIYYRYDRWGIQEMTDYIRSYGYRFSDWGVLDNARADYPECPHLTYLPVFDQCELAEDTVIFRYHSCADPACTGDMQALQLRVSLPTNGNSIRVDVHLDNKTATPYVESGSLVFALPDSVKRFRLNKPGCMINPATDIADGCNHAFYALEALACAELEHTELGIVTHDVPLVSLGEEGVFTFRRSYRANAPEMHFCLFNNMWGTNFPQWIEGSFDYAFDLFTLPTAQYDEAYEKAMTLFYGSTPTLPIELPKGLWASSVSRDHDALLLTLRSTLSIPMTHTLSCPAHWIRQESLRGEPFSPWAEGSITLSFGAYAMQRIRIATQWTMQTHRTTASYAQ